MPTPLTMIDDGALFVVNHSGGKDSQAMMLKIIDLVPADLRPALYRRYCATERAMDHTFTQPVAGVRRFLPEVTGVKEN